MYEDFESGKVYHFLTNNFSIEDPLTIAELYRERWQRARYEIGIDGDDIRWDDIDEDIHISSFFVTAEPDTNNPIAEVFRKFPQLNVSEVARTIGINKSLLSRYIYGIKKPSVQRTEQILGTIRQLGREMSAI